MKVGEICIRDVVVIKRDESLRTAANLMREYHIGSLVVIDSDNDKAIPLGIVTDRDLVIEVMAPEVNPDVLVVGDIMSMDLLMVEESQDLWEVLETMQQRGVRRVPVTDQSGSLIGILSTDDILEAFSMELSNVVKLFSREQRHEVLARK